MKAIVRFVLITSAVLFFAIPTRSQSLGSTGMIKGSVLDLSGLAVSNAEVAINILTSKVALYNLLSTFGGPHSLLPRTVVARVDVTF